MAPGRSSPLAAGAEAETRFVKGADMAKKKAAKKIIARADLGIASFADALAHAGEKPLDSATRDQKKNYSERLSNSIAVLLASRLRKAGGFKSILPNPDGLGRETGSASGAQKKLKKTDVRFATQDTGLELLVSVKTLNFHDVKKDKKDPGKIVIGRYTKNMMRNDHELRAEAMDHHERFPYAVLIGLFFIPVDAGDDARHAGQTRRGDQGAWMGPRSTDEAALSRQTHDPIRAHRAHRGAEPAPLRQGRRGGGRHDPEHDDRSSCSG